VIAGNFLGIFISGAASNNVVAGNRIGWAPSYGGDTRLQWWGLILGGRQNTIGGEASGNMFGGTKMAMNLSGTSNTG
jgi:hypothetical protein